MYKITKNRDINITKFCDKCQWTISLKLVTITTRSNETDQNKIINLIGGSHYVYDKIRT